MNGLGGIRSFLFFLCLLVICTFQIGCAKGLNGTIYLDENNNNEKDEEEVLLAGLTFTVTLDGKEIVTGITDENGDYQVEMDGAGEYCVTVDDSDLENSSVTRVSASLWLPLLKFKNDAVELAKGLWERIPLSTAVAQTTEDCGNGDDDDGDGTFDCDDSNCSSDPDCNVNDCTATDSETDGIPDCDETLCSETTECTSDDDSDSDSDDDSDDDGEDEGTAENGRACKSSEGLILTIDVPVAIDYAQTVSNLDDTETISEAVGGTATIDITFPATCTLKQLTLPDFIEPGTATVRSLHFTESTRSLDLQDTMDLANESGLCEDTDPPTAETDTLRQCPLSLNFINDGVVGEEEEDIRPQVVCPDGETYSLDTFTLQKDAGDDITIEIEQEDGDGDGTWEAGDAVTATITIENNSPIDLNSSDFDFEIETPSSAQNQDATISSGSCTGSQTISCDFDIDSESTVVVTVEYTLPGSISSTTDFVTETTFTVNETEQAFTETHTITVEN